MRSPSVPVSADQTDQTGQTDPPGLIGIDETLRLTAYEALSARERSWIKATLALVESAHGAYPAEADSRTLQAEYGLIRQCRTRPAAWALCVPGAGFASAPRFAAAIMCARLAGVENVLAIWPLTDASACSAALLTVLELTGVDRAYTLAAPASPSFWRALADTLDASCGDGRLLYFGARDGLHACLRELADARGLPLWTDRIPNLQLEVSASGLVDDAAVRWAHPDAEPQAARPDDACTALYTARRDAELCAGPSQAALILGAGLEGCWLHPNLSPGFFLTRQTAVLPDKA
ncbi:MAG: histidinol dehydrogenase [Deltaproteobacteria bacterium]|jgi:hypothetical protein|nr:histidinol dehydrogenase [Deltaproteobacteria bacterium]